MESIVFSYGSCFLLVYVILCYVLLQDQRVISTLREEIAKLEKILSELRLSADKALQDNDSLKAELGKAKVHMGAAEKLTESESRLMKILLLSE